MGKILGGDFSPRMRYKLNGHVRDLLYFLADGIYLDYAIFAKTIAGVNVTKKQKTIDSNKRLFGRMQRELSEF